MKIGLNGYYLLAPNSGIGQYTINLINTLAELDSQNRYYIFSPANVELKLPPNFHIKIIKQIPFFEKTFFNRFVWEEYQLGRAVKKYRINVFHGLYQSLPRGSDKIGNVVTIHDAIPWKFPFERKHFIYRWYSDIRKNLVAKRAKKVITVSETSKVDFAAIYNIKPETIEVTYESTDPVFTTTPTPQTIKNLKEKYNIKNDFILYTGGLKRHKNLRMLIKSFAILSDEFQYDGDLYILGAIRKTMAVSPFIYYKVEDLEKYTRMKKLSNRVIFVGFVTREEMSAFMHLAKAFVSISLYEGFGLPAVEAMTSGTPSVLSNLGAYPEIADGAALFIYPYGPHRIASAINQVLTDQKIRKLLIAKSQERAKFFDRNKIAKRVLEIYQEVYDDFKISYQP